MIEISERDRVGLLRMCDGKANAMSLDFCELLTERFKQLQASPEWQSYAKKMRPLVAKVENKLLVPAPFFRVPN